MRLRPHDRAPARKNAHENAWLLSAKNDLLEKAAKAVSGRGSTADVRKFSGITRCRGESRAEEDQANLGDKSGSVATAHENLRQWKVET